MISIFHSKLPIRINPTWNPHKPCDATASRRTKNMESVTQRVFLSHSVHHHEVSEGAFGVSDEGVRPVERSVEVLHFQKCPPLHQQHNGGCGYRTFDIQLQVDKWRYRPLTIHVRVCAQRNSATKTQGNLVCPDFSKSHTDEDTKTLIFRVGDLVVMQKRCLLTHGSCDIWSLLRTHQTHEQAPSQSLFLLSRGVHTTAFSSTLKDITDLLELDTRIFLH